MQSIDDISNAFGSWEALARACGFEDAKRRGHDLRVRRSIPVRRWPALIAAAREAGIEGIDERSLLAIHHAARSATDQAA